MSAAAVEENVHPTAVVHSSAKVDPSARIGPYAIIGEDAVIGAGTTIGPHAVVEFATLGKNSRLHAGCYVGTAPQDLKYAGERTRLVLGDHCTVRECVTLNRGTSATGETRIGSNCLFMAYSHVAHDCRIGNGVILVNSVALAGHVEVGDFTVVGGLAAVHQFTRIGRFCMVGGGSMINKDMPPFSNCRGYPARLRGLNLLGLKRARLPLETVRALKDAYQSLYLSGLRLEEAAAKVKSGAPPSEVLELLAFIESSKRGAMRPATGADAAEEDD